MKPLPRKEFLKTLSRKRVSAGVIFFNDKKQVLIVKTSYKKYWSLPGGMVDKHESPRDAAVREVKEEIGVTVKKLKLGCVAWGVDKDHCDDYLAFVFNAGVIEDISGIKIDNDEIIDYKFLDINKLKSKVSSTTHSRILESLKNVDSKRNIYIELK